MATTRTKDATLILSDSAILLAIERGEIVISPFSRECLGSNSYDVHLGKTIFVYDADIGILDVYQNNPTKSIEIPEQGLVLSPGDIYLGVTQEYTETHTHVPFLEGRSSLGRLGLSIHATAGKGDVGFCNYWTLEISVVRPVRIYAGMPIGQLIYFAVAGEVLVSYNNKSSAKYVFVSGKPDASKMWTTHVLPRERG